MLRKAPPLDATEAFLAAARAPSFRAAAQALALSPSAFSRRIQLLEALLGIALFDRSGTAIALTEAGRRYRDQIEPAMEEIRRATTQLRETGVRRSLRLMTSHSLALAWLVPRLGELHRRHGIEIELSIGRDAQALRGGAVDLAIWGAFEEDRALAAETLIDVRAVPVAVERLACGRPAPDSLAALGQHRILGVRTPANVWDRWLAAAGYQGDPPTLAAVYETNDLMYEAAAGGLGVTLAIPLLAERVIADGRLRPCAAAPVPLGWSYGLYHADPEVRARPLVATFARWLAEEVGASARRFDRWSARPHAPSRAAAA